MEVPTRGRLEQLTETLTAGCGAVEALPPQMRYAVTGVSAYLTAVEEGAPVTGHLRGNALALWETLRAAVDSPALPPPRTAPVGAAR